MKNWTLVILGMCWLDSGAGLALAAPPYSLSELIAKAQANNPDTRRARHRIDAAQSSLQQANAAFWPTLQFQSSYIRTDNPMTVFGSILNQQAYRSNLDFNDVPDTDNLNLKGMLTVPLYTGGKNTANRETARSIRQVYGFEEQAIQNELAFRVAEIYFTLLKTKGMIQAAEAAMKAFQDNLLVAGQRLKEGVALKTDLLDLEVQLAQARENLILSQNADALAMRSLHHLLGQESRDLAIEVVSPELEIPEGDDYSTRPELSGVEERVRAVAASIKGARSGYYPRVDAFGSLDHDEGWESNGSGQSYTAGVMMQWKIWDGWLTRSKVNEAEAELDMAREDVRKVRLNIEFEVARARLNLKAAAERLAVTEKAVEQAQESAQLTKKRFVEGLALSTQLIDAETALTIARVRRIQAQADRRIAISALRKALGLYQIAPEQEP